ncbi:MAG: hydroxymethylglutaryl-CoA synthase [Candidatus Aenigmarchaeota archaeon]|nr:hydroxymethylglutaryl-CoA synthase [Candidatus Aenigmarchaeota archaeon]
MIGITGYGAYIPRFRIKAEEIARVWNQDGEAFKRGLKISEKAVPAADEDTVTISVAAGKNAIARAGIDPQQIGALFIGSESHPYAVKPSGTMAVDALGIGPEVMVADFEFACKAGTAAMQCCMGLVQSGMIKYGMAIGADTAQGQPGDALEYSAAAGGAAFVIGRDNIIAKIIDTFSFTSDTPDFWRREGEKYPRHAARFTGEPAYFKHVIEATKGILKKTGTTVNDYDKVVFHMPNGKFPREAAKKLGVPEEKIKDSLVVENVGNSYSGSSIVGLTNVLDKSIPGEKILMTSFGSGAGSDSFAFEVTERITKARDLARKTEYYINRKTYVDYGTYARLRKKLKV